MRAVDILFYCVLAFNLYISIQYLQIKEFKYNDMGQTILLLLLSLILSIILLSFKLEGSKTILIFSVLLNIITLYISIINHSSEYINDDIKDTFIFINKLHIGLICSYLLYKLYTLKSTNMISLVLFALATLSSTIATIDISSILESVENARRNYNNRYNKSKENFTDTNDVDRTFNELANTAKQQVGNYIKQQQQLNLLKQVLMVIVMLLASAVFINIAMNKGGKKEIRMLVSVLAPFIFVINLLNTLLYNNNINIKNAYKYLNISGIIASIIGFFAIYFTYYL